MRPVALQASEHPIRKIFSNDFVFTVPFYQRPYLWTTEQAGELLDDLQAAVQECEDIDEAAPYFLGSVVLIKADGPDAEIVDGQQRLITLTILLSALRQSTDDHFADDLTDFLYEKGNRVIDTPDRYRLTLRERDAVFFQEHVQDSGGLEKLDALDSARLSDSQRNVQENARLFRGKLSELSAEGRQRLAQFIAKQCYLVVVATPDLDSAYRIFSVLNDRGLELSHTDILKAETLGSMEPKEQDAYTEKWEKAEDDLGREAFEDLFAHIRMIVRKERPRRTVLEEIREYVRPTADPQAFIDGTLMPYAEALDTIQSATYASQEHAEEVNRWLKWLRRIDYFDWIPPALVYLSQNRDQPGPLAQFLRDLERLAASLMIRRARVHERIPRFGRVLRAMESGQDLHGADSPLQLTREEQRETLQTLDGDLYLVSAIRLYVLLRLDAEVAEADASYDFPIVSVEHVLPQNPAADSDWMRAFPEEETRTRCVNRLGNLVLLSRRKNSQAQNYDFERKKETYFRSYQSVTTFALTTQVVGEKEWTPAVIERRQKELLAVYRRMWRLDHEQG